MSRGRRALVALVAFSLTAQSSATGAAEEGAAHACAPKPMPQPYAEVFYDNDLSYLDDPCLPFYDTRDAFARLTDRAKRISLGRDAVVDFGGEFRVRYQDENDFAKSRLDGQDSNFTLTRLRLYSNLEIGAHLRFYGEMIDARSFGGEVAPRSTEDVHTDLLNGFAEIRGSLGPAKGFLRGGRQELLFGAQRLISPLDWGNTRRSFDGGRATVETERFEVSGWYVLPRVIEDNASSETDDDTNFSGLYGTYRLRPGFLFDGYALRLDRNDRSANDKTIWTVGGRHAGRASGVFWELESAFQFGEQREAAGGADQDVRAGMLTAGLGYDFAERLPWRPRLAFAYDFATGDRNPDDNEINTFDQLFPLAHAYLGFMDLVGRRNIEALSLRFSVRPHPRLRLAVAGHQFWLQSNKDALYNAGGAPIRRDPSGDSGDNVGQELDVTATFALLDQVDLLLGYSRFWAGDFVDATNPPGVSGNADFFYTQLRARF